MVSVVTAGEWSPYDMDGLECYTGIPPIRTGFGWPERVQTGSCSCTAGRTKSTLMEKCLLDIVVLSKDDL